MKLYTPEEAAEILKIHEETVRRYLREGRLKGRKIGGWKIREQDLIDFVDDPPGPTEPEEQEEKVYTSKEVAKIMGVTPRAVQGWCNQGKIKTAFKNDKGRWRIPAEELKKLKEEAGQ